MKCSNSNFSLIMTDRCGIEIDYCSDCCGIWLGRERLNKIIEHSYQKCQKY